MHRCTLLLIAVLLGGCTASTKWLNSEDVTIGGRSYRVAWFQQEGKVLLRGEPTGAISADPAAERTHNLQAQTVVAERACGGEAKLVFRENVTSGRFSTQFRCTPRSTLGGTLI